MICTVSGTAHESVQWAAHLTRALGQVTSAGGKSTWKSFVPNPQDTTTRPGLLHGWETLLALGFKTVNIRSCCWEGESMGICWSCDGGKGKELSWLGGPSAHPGTRAFLGSQFPFCQSTNTDGIAYTQIQKICFHPSLVIDLKPWSFHPRQPFLPELTAGTTSMNPSKKKQELRKKQHRQRQRQQDQIQFSFQTTNNFFTSKDHADTEH